MGREIFFEREFSDHHHCEDGGSNDEPHLITSEMIHGLASTLFFPSNTSAAETTAEPAKVDNGGTRAAAAVDDDEGYDGEEEDFGVGIDMTGYVLPSTTIVDQFVDMLLLPSFKEVAPNYRHHHHDRRTGRDDDDADKDEGVVGEEEEEEGMKKEGTERRRRKRKEDGRRAITFLKMAYCGLTGDVLVNLLDALGSCGYQITIKMLDLSYNDLDDGDTAGFMEAIRTVHHNVIHIQTLLYCGNMISNVGVKALLNSSSQFEEVDLAFCSPLSFYPHRSYFHHHHNEEDDNDENNGGKDADEHPPALEELSNIVADAVLVHKTLQRLYLGRGGGGSTTIMNNHTSSSCSPSPQRCWKLGITEEEGRGGRSAPSAPMQSSASFPFTQDHLMCIHAAAKSNVYRSSGLLSAHEHTTNGATSVATTTMSAAVEVIFSTLEERSVRRSTTTRSMGALVMVDGASPYSSPSPHRRRVASSPRFAGGSPSPKRTLPTTATPQRRGQTATAVAQIHTPQQQERRQTTKGVPSPTTIRRIMNENKSLQRKVDVAEKKIDKLLRKLSKGPKKMMKKKKATSDSEEGMANNNKNKRPSSSNAATAANRRATTTTSRGTTTPRSTAVGGGAAAAAGGDTVGVTKVKRKKKRAPAEVQRVAIPTAAEGGSSRIYTVPNPPAAAAGHRKSL